MAPHTGRNLQSKQKTCWTFSNDLDVCRMASNGRLDVTLLYSKAATILIGSYYVPYDRSLHLVDGRATFRDLRAIVIVL